jgi:molybdenum-dependent DNA-binding transcriptional regulator ModE
LVLTAVRENGLSLSHAAKVMGVSAMKVDDDGKS